MDRQTVTYPQHIVVTGTIVKTQNPTKYYKSKDPLCAIYLVYSIYLQINKTLKVALYKFKDELIKFNVILLRDQ